MGRIFVILNGKLYTIIQYLKVEQNREPHIKGNYGVVIGWLAGSRVLKVSFFMWRVKYDCGER